MNNCKNCGKPIPDTLDYCSEDCKEESKTDESFELDPATQDLKNSIGKQVTLGLSRGPTVRGRLVAFDPKFRRIKVQQDLRNGAREETWVSLGYVVTVSIVTGKPNEA